MPQVRALHEKVLSLSLFFSFSGYPTVWVVISCQLPQIVPRAFRPCPYPKQCSLCLPVQPPLAGFRRERLGYFSAGSCSQTRCVISGFYLFIFFSLLCCPLRFQNSPQTRRCFLVFGNFSSFTTPSPGRVSIPNSFVSPFIFYILSYLLLNTMGCLSGYLVSSTSVQKLFCGICSVFKWSFNEFVGDKVVSTFYFSAILGPLLAKKFIWVFHMILQKNQNKLFGQPNKIDKLNSSQLLNSQLKTLLKKKFHSPMISPGNSRKHLRNI